MSQDFLVGIGVDVEGIPEERRQEVLAAERARGIALVRSGHLVRIWRVAGRSDSVSIWSATDPAELDDLLRSLPVHAWSRFDVTALEAHPLEAEAAVHRAD